MCACDTFCACLVVMIQSARSITLSALALAVHILQVQVHEVVQEPFCQFALQLFPLAGDILR